jgi:short-subunit dehydrogenase
MPKTVLIIGASRGIGKELTTKFSELGHNTHGFSRSKVTASQNDDTVYYQLDLTSETVKQDFENLIKNIDQIDILIHNAGQIVVKPFLELTRDEIQNCYQVNVMSVMEITQVCIPKMAKSGHIVMISSMGGFQGTMKFAGLSAYSTSKAALVSLTELLAEEYKESDFSINCLCLGAVQTEMLAQAFPGYEAPHSASEMADFILSFALNSGNYFKGKILPVSISTP